MHHDCNAVTRFIAHVQCVYDAGTSGWTARTFHKGVDKKVRVAYMSLLQLESDFQCGPH